MVKLGKAGSICKGLLCITRDQVTFSCWPLRFQPQYALCWWWPPEVLSEWSNNRRTKMRRFAIKRREQ